MMFLFKMNSQPHDIGPTEFMNIAICVSANGINALYRQFCEYETQLKINALVVMFVLQFHWSILNLGLQ